MSLMPKRSASPPPAFAREPWPEIDRLGADAAVDFTLCPTWYAVGKVMLDYAVAVLLLPIALPLIALAAIGYGFMLFHQMANRWGILCWRICD